MKDRKNMKRGGGQGIKGMNRGEAAVWKGERVEERE